MDHPAAAEAAPASSAAAAAVPNLLRQYEESLTMAISPRVARQSGRSAPFAMGRQSSSAASSEAANAANMATMTVQHASPRAVYHSPRAFEGQPPPSLPLLSPKRRAMQLEGSALDTNVQLRFDDEQKEEKEEEDQSPLEGKKPVPSAAASEKETSVQEGDAAAVVDTYGAPEDSDGCLICMDEFSARRKAYPLPCSGQCTGAYVHYRCIMAWLGQSGSCPLCRGVCDPLVLQPLQKLELRDMSKAALQPVPLDAGIIRCYVKQVYRGMFKQYGYEMYIQGQIGTQEEDRFVLAARRQVRSNMTANYVICTDKDCTDNNRIGRMGSNFLGTCFTLYDNGRDPQKLAKIQDAVGSAEDQLQKNVLQIREELGCVTYEPNRTSVGPRKMRVVIPDVDENDASSKVVRPMSRQDRLVMRLANADLKDLMRFTNREPVFREDLGAYCLDFGGRVSMASVKNFQLINAEDPSMGNILQFGRVADDMFTMDFQWPLSPFQAFAICLSSCDTKLACV